MAKVKVPKKVAGVKIPKQARKAANKAIKAAENPVVREIAAAALGAAGARKAADAAKNGNGASRIAGEIPADVERVAEAFRTAAVAGLRAFLEGLEEGFRDDADKPASGRRRDRPSGPNSRDDSDA